MIRRAVRYLVALLLIYGIAQGQDLGPARESAPENRPAAGTPSELWDVWIRFHEAELCQGISAVFVFRPTGMEVWCQVEDERSLQRFTDLVEPLKPKFAIELYATRPTVEKKSNDDKDPPPSLWNNSELRRYLQDPFTRTAINPNSDTLGDHPRANEPEADKDVFLKQRMLMYAEQTLDWDKKMKDFGSELPILADALTEADDSTRARIAAVCGAHAQQVDKYAEKLSQNLVQALPVEDKHVRSVARKRTASTKASQEIANQLSGTVQNLARRIHHFIYPQAHTVGLTELREPGLLESLRRVRAMSAEFEQSLLKATRP